jgi:putative FmdB family regulatory protein
MPIYEYECSTCGHRFEKLVRIGADAPPCPECSASEARRLISASGFILKGGGWYKDHYGLKGSDSGKSDTKTDTKTETKTETKSDTKSETRSETKKSDSGAQPSAAK